jgi:hypothetical protein
MEQNKVALVYYQPIPKLIENVNGHAYYVDPKWGVPIVWVEPEDVNIMSSLKGGCCGGNRLLFHRANDVEIKVSETGHY